MASENGNGGGGETGSSSSFRGRGRKNIRGNRTDIGWKYGTDVNGDARKVKCSFCAKVISGGVYRFKHHLAGTSDDSGPCAQVSDEVKMEMLKWVATLEEAAERKRKMAEIAQGNVTEDPAFEVEVSQHLQKVRGKASASGTQTKIDAIAKKPLKVEADDAVAEFFYTSAIAFNCIRNPAFAKMCVAIGKYGPDYKPPSYRDISDKLLVRAVDRTNEIVDKFKEEWKTTGCSIMSDGWTDRKRRSISNFMVNSPKGTVFLYSLDTSDISKTADKVFKMLDDVVEAVGEDNVIQVVTDNAANFKAGGELLMLKRTKLFWTPCAAHCIDLILEDFEKEMIIHNVTIKNARKLTTYIYNRTMLITMVRKFTNGRDLIRPALTRFATAYLTIGCLNDLKSSLINMFDSNDWKSSRFATTEEGKKMASGILDQRFWKNIGVCLKTAAPLMDVLHLVDSDEKPAMGYIYEAMDACKKQIQNNFNNVQKCYEPVCKIIDQRWMGQLHRPLHAAGYYLNPQIHFGPNFKGNDIDIKNGLFSVISKLVSDAAERSKINSQLADFHFSRGPLFGSEYAKKARAEMHPGQWWEMYGDYTPELKRFAIRILSLTCSSSGCERNWSAFEMVHTKKRNRLRQQKMNDLVYVMANMRLTRKETRKREPFEFVDIESDDEFLTSSTIGLDHNDDGENVQLPIDVEGSASHVFGSNIEDPLLFGEEFDVDGDEDIDENDVMEL